MSPTYAIQAVRRFAPSFYPKIGIILGSGLADVADQMQNVVSIPYNAVGLPASNVSGHASLMMLGVLNTVPVICFKGKLHVYEGISYEAICLWVRLCKQLGCQYLIVTGAVGSLKPEVGPGELVVVTDHINFHPGNPLVGPNDETIGPRFVSLENAYDQNLRQAFAGTAGRLNFKLHEGIYISTLGPSFETPAEIRAFRAWGADVVGMSVVPEVIAARHCGLRVLAIAIVTNLAVGLSPEKVTHEATLRYADTASRKLSKLLPEFVKDALHEVV